MLSQSSLDPLFVDGLAEHGRLLRHKSLQHFPTTRNAVWVPHMPRCGGLGLDRPKRDKVRLVVISCCSPVQSGKVGMLIFESAGRGTGFQVRIHLIGISRSRT